MIHLPRLGQRFPPVPLRGTFFKTAPLHGLREALPRSTRGYTPLPRRREAHLQPLAQGVGCDMAFRSGVPLLRVRHGRRSRCLLHTAPGLLGSIALQFSGVFHHC